MEKYIQEYVEAWKTQQKYIEKLKEPMGPREAGVYMAKVANLKQTLRTLYRDHLGPVGFLQAQKQLEQ